MTFDPDIADDLLLVDGVETITLTGSSTVTVAGAKRGQSNDRKHRRPPACRSRPRSCGCCPM